MAEEKKDHESLEPTKSLKLGTTIDDTIDTSTAEAFALYRDANQDELSPEAQRSLRWKIDLRIMPLLCLTYALQSIDKNTLSYAAVFGLREDLGLKGTDFSWTGAIFYLGFMFWEFPTSMMVQRFPINHFMSMTVLWKRKLSAKEESQIADYFPGCNLGRDSNVSRSCQFISVAPSRANPAWRIRGCHSPWHYDPL